MNYVNGRCIDENMIDYHAENHDECVFGEMLVHAMGINGACVIFCKSTRYPGKYVLGWTHDGYEDCVEILSMQDILDAFSKIRIIFEVKAV